MFNFKEEIAKKIADALSLNFDEILNYVEVPPNIDLGDYAFPCFKLAKTLKQTPFEIALKIKEKININQEDIKKIDIIGGYINIYINKEKLVKEVFKEISLKKEKYGFLNIGKGKNVVIDYSAPNIAKPFHIGHLRSTVIGGALYKIYNYLGYNSVGINYLGDWGLQFGKVMAGYDMWKKNYDFKINPIESILKIYIKFIRRRKRKTRAYRNCKKIF